MLNAILCLLSTILLDNPLGSIGMGVSYIFFGVLHLEKDSMHVYFNNMLDQCLKKGTWPKIKVWNNISGYHLNFTICIILGYGQAYSIILGYGQAYSLLLYLGSKESRLVDQECERGAAKRRRVWRILSRCSSPVPTSFYFVICCV